MKKELSDIENSELYRELLLDKLLIAEITPIMANILVERYKGLTIAITGDERIIAGSEFLPIRNAFRESFKMNLTEREQFVIISRFGLFTGKSKTLAAVGLEFGVTKERIRQIEAKALRKLRRPKAWRLLKMHFQDKK